MFPANFYMYFVTALIPLLVGAVYYNPKVLGTAWMKVNNFKEEDLQGANMLVIFGASFIFGVLISLTMGGITIHQGGMMQAMMPEVMEPGSEAMKEATAWMAKYGDNHRSFGHGALHGAFFTIFLVWPLMAINAMFERRGWKYILIHVGYWLISLSLMGGILCKTLVWNPLS